MRKLCLKLSTKQSHKQMLQRLPIALAHVKAGNKKIYLMKSGKLSILCINQN